MSPITVPSKSVLPNSLSFSDFLAQTESKADLPPSVKLSNPIDIPGMNRTHKLSAQPIASVTSTEHLTSGSLDLPFPMSFAEPECRVFPPEASVLPSAFVSLNLDDGELESSLPLTSDLPSKPEFSSRSLLTQRLSIDAAKVSSRSSVDIPMTYSGVSNTALLSTAASRATPQKSVQQLSNLLFMSRDDSGHLKLDPAVRLRQESVWIAVLESVQVQLGLSDADSEVVGDMLTQGVLVETIAGNEEYQPVVLSALKQAVVDISHLNSSTSAQHLGRLLLQNLNARLLD